MRKLMWFTVGFTAGCVPVAYLLWHNWFVAVGVLCLIAAVFLCFLKPKAAKISAAVLFGLSFSVAWLWGYDALYLGTARKYDTQSVQSNVEISDYSYTSAYGISAAGKLKLEGKTYRVIVYLNETEPLSPGDTVEGTFRLRLTTEESKDGATHHSGKGIFLLAYSKDAAKTATADKVPLKYYPAALRKQITGLLDVTFPSDAAGFAKALLLGDSTDLSYEEDTAFKVSGIRHVIAVSGLHVSILFSLVYLFFGKHRVVVALIGLPVLFVFAAVAGFTPSVMRACLMQALILIASLFDKDYDPPTSLAFSVLIILLINPLTVTSVSFQLSVGCIIGIFLLYQRIFNYLLRLFKCPKGMTIRARVTRWICGTIAVSLSAMTVTIPLSAIYFGTVSIVGVLTNLATLWVVSFVFYGIIFACVAGAIWLPLGKAIAFVVSWAIRYVMVTAEVFSSLPVSSVYTCSKYIVAWVIFCYILLALFFLMKKKKPMLLVTGIALSLLVSLSFSYIEPRLDPMRVTVMDVGSGQSVLLESHGKRYLVDCGGDHPERTADAVSQRLLSQGITKLDGVVLTHYDADHAGALPYLLTRVDADALYLPNIRDDGNVKELLSRDYSHLIRWVNRKTMLSGDWGKLTLIPGEGSSNENEISMCILFQAENYDILIAGDRGFTGERTLLGGNNIPRLDLLVVGHHGAKSSTSFELLSATRPKYAVISVGADNRYGHPSQDVLERLDLAGCHVMRTDIHGTIIYKGESIWQSRIHRIMDFVT